MKKSILTATLSIIIAASMLTGCGAKKTAQNSAEQKNITGQNTNAVSKAAGAVAKAAETVEKKKDTVGNTNTLYSMRGLAAKSGDWVYFAKIGDGAGGLYKAKEDGSNLTKLDSLYSNYISVVGDYVYYLGDEIGKADGYAAYRIKTDGTGKEQLTNEGMDRLYVVGDNLYCQDMYDNQTIYTKKVTAKQNEEGKEVVHIKYSIEAISFTEDYLYYITAVNPTNDTNKPNNYTLNRVKLDGSNQEQIMDVTELLSKLYNTDKSVLTDGKIAYIRNSSSVNNECEIIAIDLAEKKVIDKKKIYDISKPIMDNSGNLYVLNAKGVDRVITRYKAASSVDSGTKVASGSLSPLNIIIGDYLYFTTTGTSLNKRCKISGESIGAPEDNPIPIAPLR